MSEALGYRSWDGVPDACRQVRAKRRSRSSWRALASGGVVPGGVTAE